MQYPADFPPESRAAVAAEKFRAGKDFDKIRENPPRMDHLKAELRRYILRQFIVFVREACKLGHKGIWQVDHIEEAAMEFLRLSTIDAEYDKGHGVIGRRWTDNWGGQIVPEIKREFERSEEFRQFQDALLEVAEAQEAPSSKGSASSLGEGMAPVPQEVATDNKMDRHRMVDEFLASCNREADVDSKVTRKDIWRAAGHKHARQFQYWQQRSDQATERDDMNFRRILSLLPVDFVALLKKKGISPQNS